MKHPLITLLAILVFLSCRKGNNNNPDPDQDTGKITTDTIDYVHSNKLFLLDTIDFNAILSTPITANYVTWDFGDNTTTKGNHVKHTYSHIGEYKVSMHVKSATLDTAITKKIKIQFDKQRMGGQRHWQGLEFPAGSSSAPNAIEFDDEVTIIDDSIFRCKFDQFVLNKTYISAKGPCLEGTNVYSLQSTSSLTYYYDSDTYYLYLQSGQLILTLTSSKK